MQAERRGQERAGGPAQATDDAAQADRPTAGTDDVGCRSGRSVDVNSEEGDVAADRTRLPDAARREAGNDSARAHGPAVHWPTYGAGSLDRRAGKPTDGSRHRQSGLAVSFRSRPLRHRQRLRPARREADTSRVARLAGPALPARWLEPQEAASPYRDFA